MRFLFSVALLCACTLPAAAATLGDDAAGGGPDQLLPADEAFILGAERQADATIVLHWTIADGYYLYRDRTSFALHDAGEARLGKPRFAPAETKDDPNFGRTAVYHDDASVRLPIEGAPAPGATLEVHYQGCNEPVGVCYPPIERSIVLSTIDPAFGAAAGGNEQGRIAQALARSGLAWTALTFIGFGLLLALTPCVFPMLPILAGVVAGDPRGGHARRGAWLSLVFVLAMSSTYAALGVAVGLTGASIQAWFQQPWVLGAGAAMFGLLAASMFGLFDLEAPRALRAALERRTRGLGGTTTGAALLGVTSAAIVGPCVTPALIGALLYIAHAGDPITGGIALFALGVGMGVPMVAAGTAAGHLLPRAGRWMETVRAIVGVLLLAVAVWLLQRVVPLAVAMALWAALLIVVGVQMGAMSPATGGAARLWKGLGTVLLLYGALLLVGAAGGGQSLLQPLRGVIPAVRETTALRAFHPVADPAELRQALARARRAGRPVLLDLYADWCVACKELEAFTFPDADVRRALRGALLLRADVTDNDPGNRALLQHYDLYGPPAVLFFGPDGVERRGYRLVGFLGPRAFSAHVRRALPEAAG